MQTWSDKPYDLSNSSPPEAVMIRPGQGARHPPLVRGAKPLREVFFGDYVFEMPDYQRDVVWTADHANSLLEDVLGPLAGAGASAGPTYLNGITLHIDESEAFRAASATCGQDDMAWHEFGIRPSANGPRPGPVVHVVDGQQRLTTLTILVCCLRDRLDDPLLRAELHQMVAVSDGPCDVDPARRVQPRCERSEEAPKGGLDPLAHAHAYILRARGSAGRFLERHVQPVGATLVPRAADPADDRATVNLAAIRNRLGTAINGLDAATRATLVRRLRNDCYLSMVVVTDPGRGWQLFSRLNESGERLQRSDRLKAALLGPIEPGVRTRLVALWDRHKIDLGDDFDGDGARKYLFSYVADLACPGRGSIAERIMARAAETGHVAFLESVFDPIATAYGTIVRARYDLGTAEQNVRISHLLAMLGLVGRWLGQTVFSSQDRGDDGWSDTKLAPDHVLIPQLLWLASNRTDPAATLRFLSGFDRLVHGLLIHHGASHHVADRLARVADALRAGSDGLDLEVLLAPAVHGIRRSLESSLTGQVAKLVLVRLDAEGEPDSYRDASSFVSMRFDVEHVLPQSLPKSWLRLFATRADAQRHVQKLGNKFVIERRINRIVGEQAWEQKRRLYAEARVLLPLRSALNMPVWNAEAIGARTAKLMEIADRIWGFEDRPRRPAPPSRAKPRPVAADPAARSTGAVTRGTGGANRPKAVSGPALRPPRNGKKRRRRARYMPKVTGHQ